MENRHYTGKIEHTEHTVERMFSAVYFTYEKPRYYLRVLLGAVLIFLAAFLNGMPVWGRILLLMAGAWFLVSRDFPAQVRAVKTVDSRKGGLPKMEYDFYADRMSVKENGMSKSLPYKKLERLVEDRDYLYLFFSKNSCCMVEKESLKPGELKEFGDMVSKVSGLQWTAERTLLALTLYDVKDWFKGKKTKGYRLK